MAKQSVAAFLCLVFASMLLCLTTVCTGAVVADEIERGPTRRSLLVDSHTETGSPATWCIAKPSTDQNKLQSNIDECCKHPQVDCSVINPGGRCYDPQNYPSHASMAMNLYYKAFGKNPWNCDFGGSGLIITQDPSWDNCIYAA
ncbi:major pollen allergen Ole e 10-like [Telopea speciosissima]|uniref:major pollen allergen Ole e 10-like n=1 Tax=Telopea speciosissima TaxID=54955 RepID=UPI001CC55C58|nr:major pollen allergen Ole e 10-like [Telopea speciosissima]